MNTALASFADARCGYGSRDLWQNLNLSLQRGEFVAVLGPNGAGKTTILRALLGEVALKSGSVTITPGTRIGYVPQARQEAPPAPLRGRDLVGLGVDGARYGLTLSPARRREKREKVYAALAEVGALGYADAPITMLSGGEMQRLRMAQALAGDPDLMLCDEPLASLDVGHQSVLSRVVGKRARNGTGVLFVSHELTPVLPYVDRVVYVARGSARIGTVDEVMRSDVLSDLYGQKVEVIRHAGALLVLTDDGLRHDEHDSHAHPFEDPCEIPGAPAPDAGLSRDSDKERQ
ncbi:metal ABC transporter ATP-binding protein [Dermabacteraceae bacterium CCM 9519]